MKRFGAPLCVAVTLRSQVAHLGDPIVADLFLVNEVDLRGPPTLEVVVRDAGGAALTQTTHVVTASGGDTFGELLVEGLRLAHVARRLLVNVLRYPR